MVEEITPAVLVGFSAQAAAAPPGFPAGHEPAETTWLGKVKFGWLSRSKNSARNSNWPASPSFRTGVSFTNEKSTLASPGPRRKLRGSVPINPDGCIENAHGSYHRFGVPTFVPAVIVVAPVPQPVLVPWVMLLLLRPGTKSGVSRFAKLGV